MKYCFFNGKFILEKNARISPHDLGILRGYGVFDMMKIYNGKPFLLLEHFKRLENSAKELNLKLPIDESKFEKIVLKLLGKNKTKETVVRTVLTGSKTFYILIEKVSFLPRNFYENGIKVITLEHSRQFSEAKTLNYITPWRERGRIKKESAFELLYVCDGKVLECSTSNFFIIKNGILITPKNGVLGGITRNLVLKLAKKNGFKIRERDVKISELKTADEAFITGTSKKILPVVQVSKIKIGNGKVGENTKVLMKLFDNYVSKFKG